MNHEFNLEQRDYNFKKIFKNVVPKIESCGVYLIDHSIRIGRTLEIDHPGMASKSMTKAGR